MDNRAQFSWAAILTMAGCGGVLVENAHSQTRDSLAGESAAQALKKSIAAEAERYNLRYGPVRFKASGTLAVSYTDNVFYSHTRREDVLINPQITLGAFWPVTELNALRLSLGLGYEWYLDNSELNADMPLINPGTELTFNIFVGDFRIQLHERFLYQQSLFFNSFSEEGERFYNFNDVGTFSRLDNQVGFNVDWDLNKVVLSAGYNHEDFVSTTSGFEYLNRASEWFTATAGFALGDKAKTGLEVQATFHDYEADEADAVLNDHWRGRVGPFVELSSEQKISLRAGGGFDTGQYDEDAFSGSDYESYYLYARLRQDTRLFSHSLTAGREHLLGDIANNRRTTYARYSISSPVVAHVELGANVSVNLAKEFGGPFEEEFTYYGAGLRIGWLFHKFWRADLGYEFRLKDSEQEPRDFHRNRVTVSVTYSL
jgi:hypothetical protein